MNAVEIAIAAVLPDLFAPSAHSAVAAVDDGARIPEGQRHHTLLRILGAARRQGAGEAALCALLDAENQRCDPPYPPREGYALVRSVLKYAPDPDIDTAKVFASVTTPVSTSVKEPVSDLAQVPDEWRLLDDVQLVELPDPEFSIDGIVPRHAVGAIDGPPGAAKTTLVAALAGCLAKGRAFFGHEVRHRGATVYVATEDVPGFKARMMAWKRAHALALDEVLGVYTFPEAIDLLDSACVRRFTRFLQDATFILPLELLVIDTYAGVTPGANENAAADLVNDFKTNARKSLDEVVRRLRLHLLPYFGRCRMIEIDTPMVRRYIAKRQADRMVVQKARVIVRRGGRREGVPAVTKAPSPAEINRELQILKRCFNLAVEEARLLHTPHIPMLREDNVRKGFLEPEHLQEVLSFLSPELRPVVQFAYLTGWRVPSEVLPLEWSRVDFGAGEVWLDPGTTKNREGRVFPMNEDLRALLLTARRLTDTLQRERGKVIPWVFHRQGVPIRSLSKAWRSACADAGLPGRILHDMRRSAIRNMVRAGIAETVAMKLSGHKTRSVFDRYNITSTRDLHDAAERLIGLTGNPKVKPRVKLAAVIGSGVRQNRRNT